MSKPLESLKEVVRDNQLHVPSKSEILDALQNDSGSRGGLQLEWFLDRCDRREGTA